MPMRTKASATPEVVANIGPTLLGVGDRQPGEVRHCAGQAVEPRAGRGVEDGLDLALRRSRTRSLGLEAERQVADLYQPGLLRRGEAVPAVHAEVTVPAQRHQTTVHVHDHGPSLSTISSGPVWELINSSTASMNSLTTPSSSGTLTMKWTRFTTPSSPEACGPWGAGSPTPLSRSR